MRSLTVGLRNIPADLNPERAWDVGTIFLLQQIVETPYTHTSPAEEPKPLLFSGPLERVASADPPSYTGSLREDAVFSDGSPLTAADVMCCLRSVPAVSRRARVLADGERRVLFQCAEEQPRLSRHLTQQNAWIYRRSGDGGLLGTAPFCVASHERREIRLTRNPNYPKQTPLDELVFRAYGPGDEDERCSLLAAVQSGEVDFCYSLGRHEVEDLSAVRKYITLGSSTAALFLNTSRSPTDDLRLRRAIALCIDRLEVAASCYANPLAYRATSVLPRALGTHTDGVSQNLAEARGLVAAVGPLRRPLRIQVVWGPRPYLPDPNAAAETLRDQLERIGLLIDIRHSRNREHHFDVLCSGDYDMVLNGWVLESPDPAVYLETLLASHRIPRQIEVMAQGCNLSRWHNLEVDLLISRYEKDGSLATRNSILEIVTEEVPLVPLIYGSSVVTTSFRVQNYAATPERLFDLRLWDLDVRD